MEIFHITQVLEKNLKCLTLNMGNDCAERLLSFLGLGWPRLEGIKSMLLVNLLRSKDLALEALELEALRVRRYRINKALAHHK